MVIVLVQREEGVFKPNRPSPLRVLLHCISVITSFEHALLKILRIHIYAFERSKYKSFPAALHDSILLHISFGKCFTMNGDKLFFQQCCNPLVIPRGLFFFFFQLL